MKTAPDPLHCLNLNLMMLMGMEEFLIGSATTQEDADEAARTISGAAKECSRGVLLRWDHVISIGRRPISEKAALS